MSVRIWRLNRGTRDYALHGVEVTEKFGRSEVGFAVDVGRPLIGTTLRDVEKVAMALGKVGVAFEPTNPVTSLMIDRTTGKLRDDVLSERVQDVNVEFKIPIASVSEVIEALKKVSKEVNTVFSVGIVCKVDPNGSIPLVSRLKKMKVAVMPNGKVNMGLARS